ncbi:hypothetical protein Tco_0907154 [Tanacetum coccineum]|uniref:Integrase, catalytic region, zinc finger, CCHC-type, peptidase aspartic, catalytic n=1 Tax=Tanacetum coccineum TaxID=301880 RepID=A0ABQ5CPT7_9ASTR
MSSMQEDIQCAGSDTRPPMLDRTDFESWQQRIRLYCLGKDNGENIMKSIKEGPFHMGTVSDVITGGTEGAVQQGPVRARVLNDLSAEEKESIDSGIHPDTPVKLSPRILPTKKYFERVQKALFTEVKEMEEIFDQMNNEVDQNDVDKQCSEIERKNLLIANENLNANCLSNQLMFAVEQSRCLDLEAEISKLQNENQKDVNDEMIRGFNKLEVDYLNLQLKYQHLQENFRNNNSQTSQDVPEFDSFFRIKILETQLQEKDNAIRNLKAQVSKMNDRSCETYNAKDVTALIEQNECVRVELEKVKQHYKELYDSIKITRVHTREKTSTMLNEIESLKAQLKSKVSCVTSDSVKPKVLAPGMYAIDVKPILHPLKNNRSAHLTYINHLKESVETVREIVEEARVVKPLDNALNYACQYTKLSQELLEYVIGTCPKSFNERDNKAPSTPVTRKKQVTFNDKPETSSRVNTSTEASGSKPRSNTKNNKSVN